MVSTADFGSASEGSSPSVSTKHSGVTQWVERSEKP